MNYKFTSSQGWWHIPIIPALRRQKQEGSWLKSLRPGKNTQEDLVIIKKQRGGSAREKGRKNERKKAGKLAPVSIAPIKRQICKDYHLNFKLDKVPAWLEINRNLYFSNCHLLN